MHRTGGKDLPDVSVSCFLFLVLQTLQRKPAHGAVAYEASAEALCGQAAAVPMPELQGGARHGYLDKAIQDMFQGILKIWK